MSWSKNKDMTLAKIKAVLEGLDENSEGDKDILMGIFIFAKGCIRASELHAQAATETTADAGFGEEAGGDDTIAFGEEGGDFGEEAGSDDSAFGEESSGDDAGFGEESTDDSGFGEESGGDGADFGEESGSADFGEESGGDADFGEETPAKPARGAKAAPAAPADPFDGMSVQDVINLLKEAGADMEKVRAAHTADKKAGVFNYARKVNALSEKWLAYFAKGTVAQIEALAKKKGVAFKYPRGNSGEQKRKTIIADAFAARMLPVPAK